MTEIISHNLDDLIDQMHAVSDVEMAADTKHRYNILSLQAKPEEVEEWWFAVDPVDETHTLASKMIVARGDHVAAKDALQFELDRFTMFGRGGATLLASKLFPDVFAMGDGRQWHEELSTRYPTPESLDENGMPARLIGTNGVLELLRKEIQEKAPIFSQGDLPTLFMAGEMLRTSAVNIHDVLRDSNATVPDRQAAMAEQMVEHCGVLSESLLRYVSYYGLQVQDSITGKETTTESRMLSLKAAVLMSAAWMAGAPNYQPEDRKKTAELEFETVLSVMQLLFDNPEYGLQDKLKSAEVKGVLHEALWSLDAYALRKMYPEMYGDIVVTPSYSSGDAPRIGYPELRRGYDYLVWNQRQRTRDYIQLKSSAKGGNNGKEQRGKSYHPIIWELREPNFMEVNPRRLSRKLQVYRDWAESDFDSTHNDRVAKYVMQSVKWELGHIARDKTDRISEFHKLIMQYYILPAIETQKANERAANPFLRPVKPDIFKK